MKITLDDVEIKQIADQIVNDVSDLEGWAGDPHRICTIVDDLYVANTEFKRRIRKCLHEVLQD